MKRYTLWAMLALAAVAVALTAHTALASPRILGECNLTNVASVGDEDYAASGLALVTNLKAIAKLPKGGHVYQVDVTVTCSGLTAGSTYTVGCVSRGYNYWETFSRSVEVTADALGNVNATVLSMPVLGHAGSWGPIWINVGRPDAGVLHGEVHSEQ